MRIEYLYLQDYKNLRDFEISFDPKFSTSILIGLNGTGKSNVLEALVRIFRELDLERPSDFAYKIRYSIRKYMVEVSSNLKGDEKVVYRVGKLGEKNTQGNGKDENFGLKEISKRKFFQEKSKYLPRYVFGYYSGPSKRMERLFDEHQRRFYQQLIQEGQETPPLRPLLYARHIHSQFVLLAFFSEEDEKIQEFLRRHLRIEGLDSVLFVLREPPWKSSRGDPRFWNARGFVQKFLSHLYDASLAPIRLKFMVQIGFRKRQTLEHLYLYLPDLKHLQRVANQYPSQPEFFKALESTYISELLREVRIRVKVRNVDGALTYQELSEGEQQLLMVLGLLRFTNEEESLFLLDEPDTHLNPAWTLQYLDFLKMIVGDQPTSQIIMATHDPLILGGVENEQVRILEFTDDSSKIRVTKPGLDPNRMDYPQILTEIFGLRSIINPELTRLLDEKRELAAKESLTEEELKRLDELNQKLEEFDFTSVVRDPAYEPFVKALRQKEKEKHLDKLLLTTEERKMRLKLALQILEELEKDMQKRK